MPVHEAGPCFCRALVTFSSDTGQTATSPPSPRLWAKSDARHLYTCPLSPDGGTGEGTWQSPSNSWKAGAQGAEWQGLRPVHEGPRAAAGPPSARIPGWVLSGQPYHGRQVPLGATPLGRPLPCFIFRLSPERLEPAAQSPRPRPAWWTQHSCPHRGLGALPVPSPQALAGGIAWWIFCSPSPVPSALPNAGPDCGPGPSGAVPSAPTPQECPLPAPPALRASKSRLSWSLELLPTGPTARTFPPQVCAEVAAQCRGQRSAARKLPLDPKPPHLKVSGIST